MKCKNCCGNYSSRELQCPYCGTDNPHGRLWNRRRDRAEFDLQTAEESAKPVIRRYLANRALNRVLLIEAAVAVMFILFVIAVAFFSDNGTALSNHLNQGSHISKLETMYEEERFSEMYCYLQDNNMFDDDLYYEYCQMALLHQDYLYFCNSRLQFFRQTDDGELDAYLPETLVRDLHDVFSSDIPAYPDLTDRNRAVWEEYCRDAEVFATAVLGFTGEELALLKQDYLLTDESAILAEAILEGRCWDVQ